MLGETKLFCIFSFLLFAVCPALIAAQPRGDEPEIIRRMVEAVLKEISETDKKIAENKNDAELYAERGRLRVKLYRTRYLTKHLSVFYREKTPGLSVSAITTKAIADFDTAISKTPAAELLKLRGEMRAIRWFDFVSSFRWRAQIENFRRGEIERKHGKEWSDVVEKITINDEISKKKAESLVFKKFLANRDFESARDDFRNALKSSTNSGLAEEIHENLGRLFMTRAGQTANLELNRELLVRPNPFNYSISDDLDQGISHLRNGNLDKDHESGDIIRHTFYENFVGSYAYWYKLPALRTALFLKAEIAAGFGDDATALKTLNETEKLIDGNAQDGFICYFYPLRSRVNFRMKNLDSALADANVIRGYDNNICDESYETRGDVYFERGDFQAAIENYTARINAVGGGWKSEIYKKRALAYLKLNATKNAISDLTDAIEDYGYYRSPVDGVKRRIELLKFRNSLYRQIGDEKNAAKGEELIEKENRQLQYYSCNRCIFGKVMIPNGLKIDRGSIFASLVYETDKVEFGRPIVDEKGQFYFTVLKDESFHLYMSFDTFKDGVPTRYYGRSERFGRGNKIYGPVIIRLNKFVKRNSDEVDN